jgi:DNA polymerase
MNIITLAQLQYYKKLKLLGYEYVDSVKVYQKPQLTFDIDQLESKVSSCTLCNLCNSRINPIFGYGSTNSKVIFVGDKFSMQEDILGREFPSRSSQLLVKFINKILNLSINDVYITNILKCRPREDEEILNEYIVECFGYLKQQIAIIKPTIIVAIGRVSFEHLSGFKLDFDKSKGDIIDMEDYKLLGVYHPIELLKKPYLQTDMINYFKILNSFLKEGE